MWDDDTDWDEYDEAASFLGDCTCDHPDSEPEFHTYTGCGHDDCACDAHWEE